MARLDMGVYRISTSAAQHLAPLTVMPIDGVLNKPGHANFSKRCLLGLPGNLTEADSSR